jgi:hypothetical protein
LRELLERGYIIPAIDTADTDYEACAQKLADSIKHWHPDAHVTILTRDDLPRGDQGGQANDWQVHIASPYHETIKLEADMLITSPIDSWWTLFRHRDVVISQGSRDFYDRPATSRYYRKIFDNNHLPDVYNAITYWRVSRTAQEFFRWVRMIFEQWQDFRGLLKFPDEQPTTDVVYAMAAVIMGPERVTLPASISQPTIVHMKKHIIGTQGSDWTRELIWEYHDHHLRVNTVAQWGAFHYHIKDWDLLEQ